MRTNWANTAISMVDSAFQAPVVERVQKLTNLGYKVSYTTWPFTIYSGLPLPSTQVWEFDFGGERLEAEYGLEATLLLLDEAIASLQTSHKICNCSAIDLFRRGCKC
jgi:hypothetical protein